MKKLLSIILVIAIIAAMLPSAFAATAFEGYEYVFKLEAISSQASDGYRSKLAQTTASKYQRRICAFADRGTF